MSITLPKEPLPPSRVWPKKLLIYGAPKVGKTTILSQLPGCLIIECDEGGADYVSGLKIQANNLKDYDDICAELAKNPKQYKFIALDTVTKMEEWCEGHATEEYRNSTIGKNFKGSSVLQLPEGAGYNWLRMSFTAKLRRLVSACDNLILIGHLKDKYLKSLDTKEKGKDTIDVYSRDLDLTGKIRTMVSAGVDAMGFIYRTTNPSDNTDKIWVSFKTQESVNCGTRCTHLVGKNFVFDWPLIYPGLNDK